MYFKKILIFLAACWVFNILDAKEIKYPVSLIPDSLKTNAFSVIRDSELLFEIISLTETRTEEHFAITVLNENGKKDAWESISYDLDKKLEKVDVKMYDANGVLVEKWNKRDLDDVSYDDYGTAYSDTRSILSKPIKSNYPYTVEYHIVYKRNNTYLADGWMPVWGNNISSQKSTYTVKHPADIKVKYKEYNFNGTISKTENTSQVTWELKKGTMAIKNEPYMPSYRSVLPWVEIVVNNFHYGGYKGSLNSWKDFGLFINELNEGKDELPEEQKTNIDKIVSNCSSDYDKVSKLYKYMQSRTRYVNITIGIGGLQPFSAETVSENGYGDCKALSNYMKAILKHANIKSYYTLVKAGAYKYSFNEDFVSHQFNHAILCVPLQSDTIWLECTSQTMPCGFLGDFTDNRTVLLITENGGELAKTPVYSKDDNKIIRKSQVVVAENGDCTADLYSEYTGLEYDERHRLTIEDKDQQKKILYSDYNIPNFRIHNFELAAQGGPSPKLDETLELNLTSYASKSGSRMFLPLNVASQWSFVPDKVVDRKFDIYKYSTYCSFDTVQFSIPENYTVEVLPKPEQVESKYGTYRSEAIAEGNKITYVRYFDVNRGVFPAEEYDNFRGFFEEISKNDGAMAVLKKNN